MVDEAPDAEEQERLARVAERQTRNVERLGREYGSLSDEELIAGLIPTAEPVMVPVVMTMRLITAIGGLQNALKRAEKLTWALVALTVALLALTAVLAARS